jgi:hypothetical protein
MVTNQNLAAIFSKVASLGEIARLNFHIHKQRYQNNQEMGFKN